MCKDTLRTQWQGHFQSTDIQKMIPSSPKLLEPRKSLVTQALVLLQAVVNPLCRWQQRFHLDEGCLWHCGGAAGVVFLLMRTAVEIPGCKGFGIVQQFHSLACQKPTTAWKCPKHPGINACCHERPWVRCFGCQQDQSIWLVFSYVEVPWSRLGDSPCLGSSGLTCFRRFPGGKKPSVIAVPWGVTLFKGNMSVHDCLIKLQYMFTIVSIVSICVNFWYLDMF